MYDDDDDMNPSMIFLLIVLVYVFAPIYYALILLVGSFKPLNHNWPRTPAGTAPWLGAEGGITHKRTSRQ